MLSVCFIGGWWFPTWCSGDRGVSNLMWGLEMPSSLALQCQGLALGYPSGTQVPHRVVLKGSCDAQIKSVPSTCKTCTIFWNPCHMIFNDCRVFYHLDVPNQLIIILFWLFWLSLFFVCTFYLQREFLSWLETLEL